MENKDFLLREIEKMPVVLMFVNTKRDNSDIKLFEEQTNSIYKKTFELDFENPIEPLLEDKDFDYLYALFILLIEDLQRTNSKNPNKKSALQFLLKKINESGVHVFNNDTHIENAKHLISNFTTIRTNF